MIHADTRGCICMNVIHRKMIFIHFTEKEIESIMRTETDDTLKKGTYEMKEHMKNYRFFGLPIIPFFVLSVIVVVAALIGKLPNDLYGGILATAVIGAWITFGVSLCKPVWNLFGLSATLVIAMLLVYFNLIPQPMLDASDNLISGMDFLGFYIGALICGSILGMDRKLLMQSGIRYFIPIFGGIIFAYGFGALVASLFGISPAKAIMYIAGPIMGGGNGAGAVPLSEIYSANTGIDKGDIYSQIMPFVTIGNWIAIILCIFLNILGEKAPKFTGNGDLMKGYKSSAEEDALSNKELKIEDLVSGMMIAGAFFIFGRVLNKFVPAIHAYAFTILSVAIVKLSGIVPKELERKAVQFYNLMSEHMTLVILTGCGLTMMSLASMIEVLTFQNVVISFAVVLGAAIGAGLFGQIVNFYFVESAVTAGMCMANQGGNGDVLCLSACNRMKLMPYAQISSRLGGAIILILQSILAGIFFK